VVREVREARRSADIASRITSLVSLGVLTAVVLVAQDRPTDLVQIYQHAAEKQLAEWQALAKGLEPKIARMLPCDPRMRSAIEEVSGASEARLTAVTQYLQAAVAKAQSDTDAARLILSNQETRAAEMDADRSETELERVAIDARIAALRESAKKRAALGEAQQTLEGIAAAKLRVTQEEAQSGRKNTLTAALRDLVAAYQARFAALESELAAMNSERARWGEYYAARLGRAQVECSIVNQAAGPRIVSPPVQRKKQ
jgi:hypothetical protein